MAIKAGKSRKPLVRYLNWKGETIEQQTSADYESDRAFYAELRRLRSEYALAGMAGEWSQRPCKGWLD